MGAERLCGLALPTASGRGAPTRRAARDPGHGGRRRGRAAPPGPRADGLERLAGRAAARDLPERAPLPHREARAPPGPESAACRAAPGSPGGPRGAGAARGPATAEPTRRSPGVGRPPLPAESRGIPTVRWEQRRVTLLRALLVMGETADPRARPLRRARPRRREGRGRSAAGSRSSRPTGIVAAFGLEPVEDAPRRAAHAAMAILQGDAARPDRGRGRRHPARRSRRRGGRRAGERDGGDGAREQAGELGALGALVAQAEPNSIVVSEAAVPFLEPRFDLPAGRGRPGAAGPDLSPRRRRALALEPRRRLAPLRRPRPASSSCPAEPVRGGRPRARARSWASSARRGIGKTRLVTEFRRALGSDGICLEAHCLSYGTADPVPAAPRRSCRSACALQDGTRPRRWPPRSRDRLGAVGPPRPRPVPPSAPPPRE